MPLTRNSLKINDIGRLKVKGWETVYHVNINPNKVEQKWLY